MPWRVGGGAKSHVCFTTRSEHDSTATGLGPVISWDVLFLNFIQFFSHLLSVARPTTVHRFIVRGTVEEHICNWTKRDREEQTVENTLLE